METMSQNLTTIRARIKSACARSGRDPGRVRLVAVSKTKPAGAVLAALAAGQSLFGENRVLEARDKIPLVNNPNPEKPAVWHLIGPLQRNKVKLAVRLFDMIHSVDSLALAEEIAKRALNRENRPGPMPILLQVNLGGEVQKQGVPPDAVTHTLAAMARLSGIAIKGLMAIPPHMPTAAAVRPFFRQLAELAAENCRHDLPGVSLEELSMGMSGDFEVAIEEGATLVRVGSALFGPRPPQKPSHTATSHSLFA